MSDGSLRKQEFVSMVKSAARERLVLEPVVWPEDIDSRSYPGLRPRILVPGRRTRETEREYVDSGGYPDLPRREAVAARLEQSQLRGRGGGAFPIGRKIAAVRASGKPTVVVVNGAESEPLSVKDRWLMRIRPHLVLDGLRVLAAAVDAERAYLVVDDVESRRSLRAALDERSSPAVETCVVDGAGTYVSGEETAVIGHLNGGPALPAPKPPRPFESGVDGLSTLVSNVESVCNVPQYFPGRASGPPGADEHGLATTALMTLSGDGGRATLCEVPLGVTLDDLIRLLWGDAVGAHGYVMGGFFGGVLHPGAGSIELSYDTLRAAGSSLGCGAVHVLGPDGCVVAAAAEIMGFFDRENARQCGACIRGTNAMAAAFLGLAKGEATGADVDRLRSWSVSLRGRGDCATLDGAATLAGTVLAGFPQVVAEHLTSTCKVCAQSFSARSLTLPLLADGSAERTPDPRSDGVEGV